MLKEHKIEVIVNNLPLGIIPEFLLFTVKVVRVFPLKIDFQWFVT